MPCFRVTPVHAPPRSRSRRWILLLMVGWVLPLLPGPGFAENAPPAPEGRDLLVYLPGARALPPTIVLATAYGTDGSITQRPATLLAEDPTFLAPLRRLLVPRTSAGFQGKPRATCPTTSDAFIALVDAADPSGRSGAQ